MSQESRLTDDWHTIECLVASDMLEQLNAIHIWHHDILQVLKIVNGVGVQYWRHVT